MSYRYSNTDKWGDKWFLDLKPIEKLLFNYLCDNCDIAGFIELNYKKWAVEIGIDSRGIEGALKGLQRGFILSNDGDSIYLRNFLKHQKNLPLNEKNFAHKGIIKRFDLFSHKYDIQDINTYIERGLKGDSKGLGSPYGNGNGNGNGNIKSYIDINSDSKKDEKENLIFKDERIKKAWTIWKEYKDTQFRFKYKSINSEQAAINELTNLCKGNFDLAEKIVNQSMVKGWKGLFGVEDKTQLRKLSI